VWLTIRESRRTQETLATKSAEVIATVVSVHDSQAQLLDKAFALLSAKGPLEFQAVQAMNQSGALYTEPYDPSDEAEIEKMKAFGMIPGDEEGAVHGEDDELEWLRAHGVPGAP
jgi:hypothetical protein